MSDAEEKVIVKKVFVKANKTEADSSPEVEKTVADTQEKSDTAHSVANEEIEVTSSSEIPHSGSETQRSDSPQPGTSYDHQGSRQKSKRPAESNKPESSESKRAKFPDQLIKLKHRGSSASVCRNPENWKGLFVYDYVYTCLHAIHQSDESSKLRPRNIIIEPEYGIRRCLVLLLQGDVFLPSMYWEHTKQHLCKTSDETYVKTVYRNPFQYMIREIVPLVILTSNSGNILAVDVNGGESWQIAYSKLNMTPMQLKQGFDITDEIVEREEQNRDSCKRTNFLLNPSKLLAAGLPIKGHVPTGTIFSRQSYPTVTDNSPLYSLDIEDINEPIRVTVVDEKVLINNNDVFYDALVQSNDGTRTKSSFIRRFQGIDVNPRTATLLQDIKPNIEAVRNEIYEKIPSDAIILGHSLAGDFKALKAAHPNCIDTTTIFHAEDSDRSSSGSSGSESSASSTSSTPGKTRPTLNKPSLKKLAKKILKRDIQGKKHDPVEDSTATLELVKRKLENDICFSDDHMKNSIVPQPVHMEEHERLAAVIGGKKEIAKFLHETQELLEKSGCDFDPHEPNLTCIVKEGVEELLDEVKQQIKSSQVVFCSVPVKGKNSVEGLEEIDRMIEDMLEAVPDNTILLSFVCNDASEEGIAVMKVKKTEDE